MDLVSERNMAAPERPIALMAAILNAGVLVRLYRRGSAARRQQAILRMALAVREALTRGDPADYEKYLRATLDALRPKEDDPL